jgi:hypothetical protein
MIFQNETLCIINKANSLNIKVSSYAQGLGGCQVDRLIRIRGSRNETEDV